MYGSERSKDFQRACSQCQEQLGHADVEVIMAHFRFSEREKGEIRNSFHPQSELFGYMKRREDFSENNTAGLIVFMRSKTNLSSAVKSLVEYSGNYNIAGAYGTYTSRNTSSKMNTTPYDVITPVQFTGLTPVQKTNTLLSNRSLKRLREIGDKDEKVCEHLKTTLGKKVIKFGKSLDYAVDAIYDDLQEAGSSESKAFEKALNKKIKAKKQKTKNKALQQKKHQKTLEFIYSKAEELAEESEETEESSEGS